MPRFSEFRPTTTNLISNTYTRISQISGCQSSLHCDVALLFDDQVGDQASLIIWNGTCWSDTRELRGITMALLIRDTARNAQIRHSIIIHNTPRTRRHLFTEPNTRRQPFVAIQRESKITRSKCLLTQPSSPSSKHHLTHLRPRMKINTASSPCV